MKGKEGKTSHKPSKFIEYVAHSPLSRTLRKPLGFFPSKTLHLKLEEAGKDKWGTFDNSTVKLNNMRRSLFSSAKGSSAEDKEIATHLLSELEAMESEINTPKAVSPVGIGYTFNKALKEKRKSEYLKVIAKSKAFKSEKDKSDYLIKELENAGIKIAMLETSMKALRKENEALKMLVKGENQKQFIEKTQENEELKKEVEELKKVVAEQNAKLERFKKEVVERFCHTKGNV